MAVEIISGAYRGRELMPHPICHTCGNTVSLDPFTYSEYHGPVTCRDCRQPMRVVFSNGILLESGPVIPDEFLMMEEHAIPEQPLGDYQEALIAYAHGAWKASAVMTRRAIQGALLKKKVPEASPSKMIQDADKQGLLTEQQRNMASGVTFFGNKGAHPEDSEINQVGKFEAGQGLRITKQLLLALFPPPADKLPF